MLCWNQYQSGLRQIPHRSTLYFLRAVCNPSFPRSVSLGKFGDSVLKQNIQKLFKSSWLNSILVLGYINRCDFLSMGAWQKNKFHQLIFVNCFEIHWRKETWTEKKKNANYWSLFAEFPIFESIFIGFLHVSLIITFQFYSSIFLPLFLCTDGTLVIFLFTRGFVNTEERQVTSNRSYRYAQFEFTASSLSLCLRRQFKPLKDTQELFLAWFHVTNSVSFRSNSQRMPFFFHFCSWFIISLLWFFFVVVVFFLVALLYSSFAMDLNEEYLLQLILPMRLLRVMGKPWQLIWSSSTCSVCSASCEDPCSSL